MWQADRQTDRQTDRQLKEEDIHATKIINCLVIVDLYSTVFDTFCATILTEFYICNL